MDQKAPAQPRESTMPSSNIALALVEQPATTMTRMTATMMQDMAPIRVVQPMVGMGHTADQQALRRNSSLSCSISSLRRPRPTVTEEATVPLTLSRTSSTLVPAGRTAT